MVTAVRAISLVNIVVPQYDVFKKVNINFNLSWCLSNYKDYSFKRVSFFPLCSHILPCVWLPYSECPKNYGIHFVPIGSLHTPKYAWWSTCSFENCHFVFWHASKGPLFLELERLYSAGTDSWWLNSFISNMNRIHQTILTWGACTYIPIAYQKPLVQTQWGSELVNPSKSQDHFFTISILPHILHVWESKKELC